jgi:hypothetical protein
MFNNYLWGRDLLDTVNYSRISKFKLHTSIINGGFGMLNFREVVNGIRCKQLGKMFSEEYNHPLARCVLKEQKSFASRTCLSNIVDRVGKLAHELILGSIMCGSKNWSNENILSDRLFVQQLGETETFYTVKPGKRESREIMILVYELDCFNFKETIEKSKQDRRVMSICKNIMSAKYLRILKLLVRNDIPLLDGNATKVKLVSCRYKEIDKVTSKEFRLMLKGKVKLNVTKLGDNLEASTIKEYFAQIKRLPNTRHKNTLLRIWNGDCLSNSRLYHFGIAESNTCPRCNDYDSSEHMLINCITARRVWDLLMQKIPKSPNVSMLHYAIGINDTKSILMVKAEILKYIMHYRELQAEEMILKSLHYLKLVHKRNAEIETL